MYDADYWIKKLNLIPHPEGGFYKETYTSPEIIRESFLPIRYMGDRSFGSQIFYLLRATEFSALHRLKSDEIWHFYTGSPLSLHILNLNAKYEEIRLGSNLERDERFNFVIPAYSWFGASLMNRSGFSLVGCTVVPGFDFRDFELGKREKLIKMFPSQKEIITMLTK